MDPYSFLPTLAEVREEFRDESTVRFAWTIPDCSELRCKGFYRSTPVGYFKADYFIMIEVAREEITEVYLTRNHLGPEIPESIVCTIRWKEEGGWDADIVLDETMTDDRRAWPTHILLLPGRRLTFTCTLQSRGVSLEVQTEDTVLKDISSLSEHFKNLLLSGDGHDVLIKVGDSEFKAHKHILKSRSPVFAAMFSNETLENTENSLTVEDCDPNVFGDFLQFVYSGAVDTASVSRVLGLHYVADKYDFPSLKQCCVDFLKTSFTPSTVFEVIQLAARHGEEELLQRAIAYFGNHLEEVMLTVEWQRFLSANPIPANEMSLKAVQFLKSSLDKK